MKRTSKAFGLGLSEARIDHDNKVEMKNNCRGSQTLLVSTNKLLDLYFQFFNRTETMPTILDTILEEGHPGVLDPNLVQLFLKKKRAIEPLVLTS